MKLPVALFVLVSPLGLPAQPSSSAALEALGRQDPTGQGTFHRIGLMRLQEGTVAVLGKITERVSGQVRANTMLFASDNIFNTPDGEVADEQLAQFLGASVKVTFLEELTLNTSYDFAFFRHSDDANSGSDFDTRTFRQQLGYETSILDGKVSVGIPLTWQHSQVFAAGENDALAKTWTYGSGVELTWFRSSRVLPTFSYNYFLSDPKVGAGKHKHDFNLGVTFIPLAGKRLFISPSVQYSHEDFKKSERMDDAWTPTLAVSWGPLSFFAVDAVASYTDSQSSNAAAEFEAITGTLFARLFWKW
jgi:hypothetical protein